MMTKQLSLAELAELNEKMAEDFISYSGDNLAMPSKLQYNVGIGGDFSSLRSSRLAVLASYKPKGFVKQAFDTRRVDQEHSRNPRSNLQYWHRSQEFIEAEDQRRIDIFAKLLDPLEQIKQKYGTHVEYFDSYSRVLHDAVNRVLRIKEADQDIFRPQLNYLEQLLFARYRLDLEKLEKSSKQELEHIIISRDEKLLKRGTLSPIPVGINKNGDETVGTNIVNAIFGNNEFRRHGEKSVTRTITITITDKVDE